MIVTGHEAFLLTLLFVVTGYITHSVAARFTFRKNERPELLLLRFLAYGTLNALVSLPLITMHTKVLPRETWTGILVHNLVVYYGLAVWTLFLIPALLGIVIGIFHTLYGLKDWFNAPVASWDERIARSRGQWVLVTLEDGTKAMGYLGRGAAVISDTGERDLYLQTLYQADADEVWRKVPRSKGVLISGKGIRSIEFWEDEVARPARLRDRLKAWASSVDGNMPPLFQSSLIASIAEPAKALESVGTTVEDILSLEGAAAASPKAVQAEQILSAGAGQDSSQPKSGSWNASS